ncbi:MAG: hypothetical protein RIC35_09150 [Marinoscillum sp.]
MKKLKIIPLILLWVIFFVACTKDDDITELNDKIDELENAIDTLGYSKYKDSLNHIIKLKELEYRQFVDSLRRADSITVRNSGNLPFSYNVLVFDGSNTSVGNGEHSSGERVAAFSGDVTVTIAQFGVTQTQTSSDGIFHFENVGRGIIIGSISAEGYSTVEFSTETLIRPTEELIDDEDYMVYVVNSSLGHSFAIFSLTGENSSVLGGRAFVETDLTNAVPELAPEGTRFLAYINVDDEGFKERYVYNQNKQLFTDNIISFGYSPALHSTLDAAGDYSFTLPASPSGLPIRLEYSDFIANQVAYVEDNGDLTERTVSAVYGPSHSASTVPSTTLTPSVSFSAGGGASATVQVSGTGSVTAINLVNGGQNFQGVPRVIISSPATAGGVRATATATVSDGVVTAITLTNGGSGYISTPSVTITEGDGASAVVSALYPNDFDSGNNTGGGVGSVHVTSAGVFWNTAPVTPFVFFNGVLEGSAANIPDVTVAMNAQGNIRSITVNSPGYGYTSTPSVTFSAGSGALGQVTSVDGTGSITGVNLTNTGQYYAAVAQINVNSTGGTGAQLSVQINNAANNFGLMNLQVQNGGSGYTVGDVITFTTALNAAASAFAVWEGMSVESYQITSSYGGSDADLYINTPLIVFSEPDYDGTNARRATGTAIISNGRLAGINITDHGRGYYSAPSISLLSGDGASGQPVFDEMKISGFNITNQGAGYLQAPDLLIVDHSNAGSGAEATANLTDGRVTSITLSSAGSGYINVGDVEVVILDPGMTYDQVNKTLKSNPAEAEVEVTDGVITAINIISGGDNYKAANVMIESTKGSGFLGAVTSVGGRITGVTVTSGGVGYVNGNNPGSAQSFSGTSYHTSLSGITRILDINYGTGKIR